MLSAKEAGGIRLVNIKAKHAALKIAWIFWESDYVQNLLAHLVPDTLGTYFWDCTLNKEHVQSFLPRWAPEFWIQVIEHWFNFKWALNQRDRVVFDTPQVCNQIL